MSSPSSTPTLHDLYQAKQGGIGYDDLLLSAGAHVEAHQTCGSYQGDIVFRVRRADGVAGMAVVAYGSCSGCDALEAAVGYNEPWTGNVERDLTALRDQIAAAIIWAEDQTLGERVEDYLSAGTGFFSYDDEVSGAMRRLAVV